MYRNGNPLAEIGMVHYISTSSVVTILISIVSVKLESGFKSNFPNLFIKQECIGKLSITEGKISKEG